MTSGNEAFDRLLAEATFFPGLNVRLAALRPLKRIAEEQLDYSRSTEVQRVREEHGRLGVELHSEDKGFDLEELEQQVIHLLPKLTRGGLLLMAWSVFERSVKDIALRAADFKSKPLSRAYFRRGDFFSKAEAALQEHAGVSLFEDQQQKDLGKLLKALRDVLIHHDGRMDEALPVFATQTKEQLARIGVQVVRDYDFKYLVPNESFLDQTVEFAYDCSHSLARRVFNALNPTGKLGSDSD